MENDKVLNICDINTSEVSVANGQQHWYCYFCDRYRLCLNTGFLCP